MATEQIPDEGWRAGEWTIHRQPPALLYRNQVVALDSASLLVLLALLAHAGEPLHKDELLAAGWPGRVVHENSLAKAISRLRAALKGSAMEIRAVHGFGYRLLAESLVPLANSAESEAQAPQIPDAPKRHWRWLAPMATGMMLLVLAAGFSSWQDDREDQQAAQLLQFLAEDLLVSVDPYATETDLEKQNEMRFMVERIVGTMDDRFADQPKVLMTLHHAVARAFSGWGEYDKAVNHLQLSRRLADELGMRAEAIALEASLCNHLRLAGKTHAAEQACEIAVTNAARSKAPGLAKVRTERAKLLFEVGDYPGAVQELTAVIANADTQTDPEIIADAHWFLGLSQRKLARYQAADEAFQALVATRHQLDQASHPLMAWAYTDYGDYLVHVGRYPQAEVLLARAQEIFDATLGPVHVESVAPAYSLGVLFNNTHQWQDAINTLVGVLTVYRDGLGADHLWTLYTLSELALAHAGAGQGDEANRLLTEARAIGERQLYGRPAKAAHFHLRWTRALLLLKQTEAAETELTAARSALTLAYGDNHPLQASSHCLAASLSLQQGNLAGARLLTRHCAERMGAHRMPESFPLHRDLAALNQALAGS